MNEPKPFASLSSSLLARKGTAKPAMRRQGFGGMVGGAIHGGPHGYEDLGWNDMGGDGLEPPQSTPLTGLSPMLAPEDAQPEAPDAFPVDPVVEMALPPVVEQRRMLAEKVGAAHVALAPQPKPGKRASVPATREQAAGGHKGKAAFTLRLDAERHLKLRLACAVSNRSAQQIVTEALDHFLEQRPDVEALAVQLPRTGTANH